MNNAIELSCINLFQPWGDGVISGKFPILIRSISTSHRESVGVAVTEGFDGIFFNILDENELLLAERYLNFNVVIGMVDIFDCFPVKRENVLSQLKTKVSKDAFYYYPVYMIPNSEKVFFWVLKNPKRFMKPILLKSKGITWSKIKIEPKKLKISRRKGFWNYYDEKRYIQLNNLLRKEMRKLINK